MTERMSMNDLQKRFGTADDFTPSSDPIDNQRGLQRWVFTFVTRAGGWFGPGATGFALCFVTPFAQQRAAVDHFRA